jgi:hypothetical protein
MDDDYYDGKLKYTDNKDIEKHKKVPHNIEDIELKEKDPYHLALENK